MADGMDKKPSGSGSSGKEVYSAFNFEGVEVVVGLLLVLLIFRAVLTRIRAFLSGEYETVNGFLAAIINFFNYFVPIGKLISLGISALCVIGILFLAYKISKIRNEERAIYYPAPREDLEIIKNRKWQRVEDHINSTNPNDWKLAILEADIILDEMLDSMGYRGATMSDKLKSVEKSDFTTIDNAWEGHKVRNAIAHEGADFVINEREAKRIIGLYETVFKEFNYV